MKTRISITLVVVSAAVLFKKQRQATFSERQLARAKQHVQCIEELLDLRSQQGLTSKQIKRLEAHGLRLAMLRHLLPQAENDQDHINSLIFASHPHQDFVVQR